jgi:hypothetical protein
VENCGLLLTDVIWNELSDLRRFAALGVFYQSNQQAYEKDFLVAQGFYPQLLKGALSFYLFGLD